MRVPFFHYTYLDSLPSILKDGRVVSRYWLAKSRKKFTDISIDSNQPVRERLGLLEYIPLFPGFYTLFRGYELNGYLMQQYDDPKVQNKSFYGSLNKVLQFKKGVNYDNVIILLVNDELVYNFADQGKIRCFSDIAVKPNAHEYAVKNRADLLKLLSGGISGSNISGEIDLLDDGKSSIALSSEIEALIVDNDGVKKQVTTALNTCSKPVKLIQTFISQLPRDDPDESSFDS